METYSCNLCNTFKARTLRRYMNHINLVHSNQLNFSIKCNVGGCPSIFKRYNSYYRHVIRHHNEVYKNIGIRADPNDEMNQDITIDDEVPGPNDDHGGLLNDNDDDHNMSDIEYDDDANDQELNIPRLYSSSDSSDSSDEEDCANEIVNDKDHLKKCAAMFILKTKERNRLTQATMDRITNNTTCLIDQYVDIVKQEIADRINSNEPVTAESIAEIFDDVGNVFDGLSTEAQHKSYVKANFPYVEPQKIKLGSILVRKKQKSEHVITEKEETFMYIPLLESLSQILRNGKLEKLLCKKPSSSRDGCYYDFFDGSIYKNDPYFAEHPKALVLILYHDELEVCNPLSSSAGEHKIDMYYYCIANLPPQYRSRHCAVKLLAIANASLVKKYGIEKILEPVIDELLLLHNGFEMEFENGQNKIIHGKVLVCLGDTPGQHLWAGFKEGVGTSYQKCRHCYCNFDELQSKFKLTDFTPRTETLHKQDCYEIENAPTEESRRDLSVAYGINKRSILMKIPGFNIITQLPQDIMHIAFEGVVQYELRLVIEYFIKTAKLTTLDNINASLINHSFGYTEVGSKPHKIKDTCFTGDEKYKLKFKADQARLFLRISSFVLEPLIDVDDEHFKFITQLVEIMQILCSSVIRKDTITELNQKLENHYIKFKELFPTCNLVPKHHYLLHIVDTIKMFGPPMRYSCYSFEAAHNYFKSIARVQNFKNLPLSLAKRYQYLETSNFGDSKETAVSHPLFDREKDYGVVSKLSDEERLSLRRNFDEFGLLPGIAFDELFKVSWLVRFGTKYNSNAILAVGVTESNLPMFGQVCSIYVIHDLIYFKVKLYRTLHYSEVFHAYNVDPT
eukprot:TCONS_00009790-protein